MKKTITILFLATSATLLGQVTPDTFALLKSPAVLVQMPTTGSNYGGKVDVNSDTKFAWVGLTEGDQGYFYAEHKANGYSFSFPSSAIVNGQSSKKGWDYISWAYRSGTLYINVRPFDAFVPENVENISLILDANDAAYTDAGTTIATNGQSVYQWNDQSGNTNNAIQDTSGRRPILRTNRLNGLASVDFDGSDDRMKITHTASLNPLLGMSIFCVADAGTTGRIFQKGYGGVSDSIYYLWYKTGFVVGGSYEYAAPSGNTIYSAQYTGNYERNYRDGTLQTYSMFTSFSGGDTDTLGDNYTSLKASLRPYEERGAPLILGARYGSTGLYWNGELYYLLLVQREVSDRERQSIEGALAWRYGLQSSLPTTHPYRYHHPKAGYWEKQWGSEIVTHNPKNSFRGSPSITILPNGNYMYVCDQYNTLGGGDTTLVYTSSDTGQTWALAATLLSSYWPTPFVSGSDVYLFGMGDIWGSATIAKSSNNGATWSTSTLKAGVSGISTQPSYSSAPIPVLEWNGYYYKALERINGTSWPDDCEVFVMRAATSSTLTDSASWQISNFVAWDTQWLDTIGITTNTQEGFAESGIIEGPDGNLKILARAELSPVQDKAVLMNFDTATMTVSFNQIIDLPGGKVKFMVYDDRDSSGYYVTITNRNTTGTDDQRNISALYKSTDLISWTHAGDIMVDDYNNDVTVSHDRVGFQYAHFITDGDDLLVAHRVAYTGAPWLEVTLGAHDAERVTLTRIRNFRNLLR